MKIGIIGQGFVGNAVTQAFKNFFQLLTYDINDKKSNSTLESILINTKYIFVCLPTPMNSDGSCNLEVVDGILKKINSEGKKYVIILKSTVVPETTEKFNNLYKNLSVVFNPEFLTERNAVNDFKNQKRIILGGPRPATSEVKNLFSRVFPNVHIIKTGSTHAEFIKYLTNSFLATKVSFANEMFDLANKLNLDYDKIIEYTMLDDRIGNTHLSVPGPDGDLGFGGHCFPKDLSAIIKLSDKYKSVNNILKAVIKTNDKFRKNRDWEKMKGRAVS